MIQCRENNGGSSLDPRRLPRLLGREGEKSTTRLRVGCWLGGWGRPRREDSSRRDVRIGPL